MVGSMDGRRDGYTIICKRLRPDMIFNTFYALTSDNVIPLAHFKTGKCFGRPR